MFRASMQKATSPKPTVRAIQATKRGRTELVGKNWLCIRHPLCHLQIDTLFSVAFVFTSRTSWRMYFQVSA